MRHSRLIAFTLILTLLLPLPAVAQMLSCKASKGCHSCCDDQKKHPCGTNSATGCTCEISAAPIKNETAVTQTPQQIVKFNSPVFSNVAALAIGTHLRTLTLYRPDQWHDPSFTRPAYLTLCSILS